MYQTQLPDATSAPAPAAAPGPAVAQVKRNSRALDKWRAQHVPPGVPPPLPSGTPLAVNRVFKHLQARHLLRVCVLPIAPCCVLISSAWQAMRIVSIHAALQDALLVQAVLDSSHALVVDIG